VLYAFFGSEELLVLACDYPAGSVQTVHRHDVPQLLHAARGVMRMTTPTGYWVIPPGRGVWISAFVPHEIRMVGPVSMRTLYLGGASGQQLGQQCSVIEVASLLRELLEALATTDGVLRGDVPRHRVLSELALIELSRAQRLDLHVPMPTDARLRRVCAAVLAHPERPVTLEELAEQSGASPRTLRRLFQDSLGMSFAVWRQQARLVEALALLGEGRPVAAISRELGYASPSAFTAMFKRMVGSPPTAASAEPVR
jgi:AraC-like DNA-binding protein